MYYCKKAKGVVLMATDTLFFQNVVGNEALKKRLSKDVAENHLSHAYVIEGERGSGRHTVALSVAAAIECESRESGGEIDLFGAAHSQTIPCGSCPSCEKIFGGKSPDVITVGLEDDKVTIGVETVRNVKNDMYTAPNDLSVKVYIIEDADSMTVQAQNAFLLSLEEPPEYVLFFLICENSGNLLETVRSRAPTLRTVKIADFEIEKYLLENEKRATELRDEDEESWKMLIFLSGGSIGRAIELLDTKKREKILENRKDAEAIIGLLGERNRAAAFEVIASFGSKRNEIIGKLSYLQYALRDLLLLKKDENAPLCFFFNREAAQELSTRFTAPALLSLYDATVSAIDDLEANANVRLTLMNMLQSAALI